jgi:carbamoylphosphate synthase large subunit
VSKAFFKSKKRTAGINVPIVNRSHTFTINKDTKTELGLPVVLRGRRARRARLENRGLV